MFGQWIILLKISKPYFTPQKIPKGNERWKTISVLVHAVNLSRKTVVVVANQKGEGYKIWRFLSEEAKDISSKSSRYINDVVITY